MNLYEEFRRLIDALNEAGVEYALCGGIAVAFYGFPRFTEDIDLLVLAEDMELLKEVAKTCGFVHDLGDLPLRRGSGERMVARRFSKALEGDVLPLDLLVVNSEVQSVWENREVYEWRGRRIQIVSPQGLATLKKLANRDQDQVDLKRLGLELPSDESD